MTLRHRRPLAALCLLLLATPPAAAQRPAAAPTPGPQAMSTNEANAGTIEVISGGVQGTYIRIAADMASTLDDGSRLRVLPIVGRGSVQNIQDLLFVRGVDVAIVQADVLSYLDRERSHPGMHQSVQYITKLYDEEVHVLARADIATLADLTGKPVNVDGAGSGTAMTAAVVFDALGVRPELRNDTQATALDKLKRGEIAALVYVAGKPASLFTGLPPATGLHFLPIPMSPALLDTYLPARLEHGQYALVPDGQPVDTLAVGAVMAVYAWPRNTVRYEKVARFVGALFANIGRLRMPPNHPKWGDVNLAAQLPGWVRFAAAQDAVRKGLVQAGKN